MIGAETAHTYHQLLEGIHCSGGLVDRRRWPGRRGDQLSADELPPELFGDERHGRVEILEDVTHHHPQRRCGGSTVGWVPHEGLGHLEVPIEYLGPGEAVDEGKGVGESVFVEELIRPLRYLAKASQDPLILGTRSSGVSAGRGNASPFDVVESEAGRVPQLVAEPARSIDPILLKRNVLPGAAAWSNARRSASAPYRSTRSSGSTALLSDFDILRPSGARHQTVDHHLGIGGLAGEMDAHLHHSGHPEVDDVETGDEHAVRIEGAEIIGVLGHPNVEKGHNADENHVSRTSSSAVKDEPWHAGQAVGSALETITSSQSSQ